MVRLVLNLCFYPCLCALLLGTLTLGTPSIAFSEEGSSPDQSGNDYVLLEAFNSLSPEQQENILQDDLLQSTATSGGEGEGEGGSGGGESVSMGSGGGEGGARVTRKRQQQTQLPGPQ